MKIGNGSTTLKEEITLIKNEQLNQKKFENQNEKQKIIFGLFFTDVYVPAAIKHKKEYSIKNETRLFNKWIEPEIGHLPFNKIKPFNLEKIKKKYAGFR